MSDHRDYVVVGNRVGKVLAAGLAGCLLAACSTVRPEYGPRPPGGLVGFEEVRVAPNRYEVTFSGSTTSTRQDVENRLAQRAAEVTLQSGYTHFVINMRDTELNLRRQVGFIPDTYLHGPDYFNRARRWSNIPLAFEGIETSYSASAEIAMLRADEVPGNVAALSALEVIRRLQPSPPLAIASVAP